MKKTPVYASAERLAEAHSNCEAAAQTATIDGLEYQWRGKFKPNDK
jgi:hypothetical protein